MSKCCTWVHITEPETLAHMEHFLAQNQLSISGLHHKIYLSDPRKVEPAKMKTILRYPVQAVEVVKG